MIAMMKFAYFSSAALVVLVSCSGSVSNDNPQSGGSQGVVGGASSEIGGTTSASGGAISSGGFLGLGGTPPASGGTSTQKSNTGGSPGFNCANVGCATPPLCSTGCTEVCGCCPCSEGAKNGNLVCKGGCWAESGAGGSSSTGGASSTGGKSASGGNAPTGGVANTGGGLGTSATNVCGTGCSFETTDSPFCSKGLASIYCQGGTDFLSVSAIMRANGCSTGASDAIRFCCPPAILMQCQ